MKLCDWCEALISESEELCAHCLKAKADVAAGNLVPSKKSKKPQQTILRQIGNGVVLTLKGFAILALGTLIAITGLLGTCSAAAMVFTTIAFALPWPLFYLLLTAIWFGIAYGLWKLTQRMLKPPLVSINAAANKEDLQIEDNGEHADE